MRRQENTTTRTTPRTSRRSTRRQGGWNLIELLVVVAIIVILLAIIVNVASERTGPIEQTKSIVSNAKNVYEEYFVSTGTVIDHTTNPPNTNFGGEGAEISRFVYKVRQNKAAFDMLMTLGGEAVGEYRADVTTISDAWGNPLKYGYNVKHQDAYTDDDMLPQTQNEAVFGSAGQDGRWGRFENGQPNKDAQDNIYSELNMN